jgi:hypothetical protein
MPKAGGAALARLYPLAKMPKAGGAALARLYPLNWKWWSARLPDVVEGVIDGALLRLALMLFEVGLKLLFGFFGVGDKFPSRPEG